MRVLTNGRSPAWSGEGGGHKMGVTHSGCHVGMKGHEEKPHSAAEKDTLMQKASASRLSVSSGSRRTDDGRLFFFHPLLQRYKITFFWNIVTFY